MELIKKIIPRLTKEFLKKALGKHSLIMSQAGQDYWVYGESFNEKKCGYFLDIGSHDGLYISNTYILESKYNWSGICIEANPITFEKLKKNRNVICLNVCLDQSEGEVEFALRDVMGGIVDDDCDNNGIDTDSNEKIKIKTISLNRILEDNQAPRIIDYLSIDVEGAEERILAEFDFHKYIFRCITIERPSELLRYLFKNNGYILIKEIPGLDCFYVHQDFLSEYTQNLFKFHRKKHFKIRWD